MRSVLLDTNLILLLIVGGYDKNLIGRHKRTRTFDAADYELLVDVIKCFDALWVTSYCLAEVSNLLRQTDKRKAKELMCFFARFANVIRESHITKDIVFANSMTADLGVSDVSVITKSKRVSCVLTEDLDLYLAVTRTGRQAINFNHLRQERLTRNNA